MAKPLLLRDCGKVWICLCQEITASFCAAGHGSASESACLGVHFYELSEFLRHVKNLFEDFTQ